MGSGGVARGAPPGRVARSPATIVRRPVSASTRTSANGLLHGHVLDPGLDEHRAAGAVAVGQVEILRVGLGVEDDPSGAAAADPVVGGSEQAGGDALPAVGDVDGQAAQLHRGADEDQAQRADDAAVLDRQEVDPLAVATVDLVALGHALLLDEHAVAQADGRLALLVALRRADLDAHEFRMYLRTSASSAASLR